MFPSIVYVDQEKSETKQEEQTTTTPLKEEKPEEKLEEEQKPLDTTVTPLLFPSLERIPSSSPSPSKRSTSSPVKQYQQGDLTPTKKQVDKENVQENIVVKTQSPELIKRETEESSDSSGKEEGETPVKKRRESGVITPLRIKSMRSAKSPSRFSPDGKMVSTERSKK